MAIEKTQDLRREAVEAWRKYEKELLRALGFGPTELVDAGLLEKVLESADPEKIAWFIDHLKEQAEVFRRMP